jgi:predicted nucleotidyltransferase
MIKDINLYAEQQRPLGLDVVLEGVTGSVAYGLDNENSDIDIKGVYQLPTAQVMSLRHNAEKTTVVNTDPDFAFYEIAKFMKLVAGGNPTVSELLWLDSYTHISPVGQLLIDNRKIFLSTPAVMNAYRGYALGQAKKLSNRQAEGLDGYDSALKNRFAKHTRHCFRLLLQCRQLLETGELTVKVTPEEREWLFKMGEQTPETVVDAFIAEDAKMEDIVSVLPDEPDWEAIDALLYKIRKENMRKLDFKWVQYTPYEPLTPEEEAEEMKRLKPISRKPE